MMAQSGVPVTLVGRPAHVEAIARDGLRVESTRFDRRIRVDASTDLAAVRGATLVFLAVKTVDTETTARSLMPFIDPEATIVTLQNGVDGAERVRAATGLLALPAVVYVAVEMAGAGHVKHTGRGDLVLGDPRSDGSREREIADIAALLQRADIPCTISDDIERDLWIKLIMNCAFNAISALTLARYGEIARTPATRDVACRAVAETVAVAHAAGVRLPDTDFVAAALRLAQTMAEALSSTAQDIVRGRRTEIDSLNGYVASRGTVLGVDTPVNATLHALVRLRETSGGA
jgi:2-dehydropantoate 2-reductase